MSDYAFVELTWDDTNGPLVIPLNPNQTVDDFIKTIKAEINKQDIEIGLVFDGRALWPDEKIVNIGVSENKNVFIAKKKMTPDEVSLLETMSANQKQTYQKSRLERSDKHFEREPNNIESLVDELLLSYGENKDDPELRQIAHRAFKLSFYDGNRAYTEYEKLKQKLSNKNESDANNSNDNEASPLIIQDALVPNKIFLNNDQFLDIQNIVNHYADANPEGIDRIPTTQLITQLYIKNNFDAEKTKIEYELTKDH